MIISLITDMILSFIRLLPKGFLMMEVINIKWVLSYAISLLLSALLKPGICPGHTIFNENLSLTGIYECIYLFRTVFMRQRKYKDVRESVVKTCCKGKKANTMMMSDTYF